ncbi:hypothetical protein EYF80_024418 [Liparis tanakae]|uniref:Uncharacterized protein n=1 Tax=Liparis tanakae TaxID=230148 RepID=A0A4Z2HKH6_9TELE|nr:hypothetical protein EYF80_024418 [Liparis tanakae]
MADVLPFFHVTTMSPAFSSPTSPLFPAIRLSSDGMSPSSRDFHFESLLSWVKTRRPPSTDSSIEEFLLISRPMSQSHNVAVASTSDPLQGRVWTGSFCRADRHLDDITHISMPRSIQIHCWDSESRLQFFSRTSPDSDCSKHKLLWVLWIMNALAPAGVVRGHQTSRELFLYMKERVDLGSDAEFCSGRIPGVQTLVVVVVVMKKVVAAI